ncbi:class E basic helix-loop-helix protein 41-like [Panthera pardus]|uniref:Class E basic helix-loop-helix protein 41-like n=2 Tax=Panthera TaxID=9688 RepID=A0A9W2UY81_PANPR|nr:class E basic helix-loop-helix protein 41-like [Panthera pardus]
MRLRRPPPPGFRRRQWARVTVPARPPGEARPGPGRLRWRPRAAGAGGAAAAGTAGRGASRGGGRGAAAAWLQELAAAAAELVGGPARRPRPPGLQAWAPLRLAVRSSSPLAGARPRKAGVQRRAELDRPGFHHGQRPALAPLRHPSSACQALKAQGMVECCLRSVGSSRLGSLRPPGRAPNQPQDSRLVQLSRTSESLSRS